MSERKPSGFRFRLPWLLQPALTSRPAIAPEPPSRTTKQTSVASTPAQRPPFRPPGIAPAPAPPPTLATPAPPPPPASPTRAQPRSASLQASVASSPPPVPANSSAPKSPIAKTLDPVANQPTKETQTTRETPGTAVPPAAALTVDNDGETQPTKQTQAATKMASPATPPAIAKVANTIETHPTKETPTTAETEPTIQTATPATPPDTPPPPSPLNIQPVQTGTAPRSSSFLPSSPSITAIHNTPEIKRSQGGDLVLDAKSKEIAKAKETQTKSLNPHSMEKTTKPIASARVSLHREIKDDVFKFIRKMTTTNNPSNRDEKPASVVTIAGENTGASMHLGVNSDRSVSSNEETTAIVNGNVQGVNNSMVFNGSVTERNPGVHVGFSRNLVNSKDNLKMEKRESMETHKAEASISPQQTLVYDPTIGRCLEGVSMEDWDLEAADDDDDDPDKSSKSYEIEVV